MKKLVLLFLLFPTLLFAQLVPTVPNTYGTIADLRMQSGFPVAMVNVSGLITVNDGNGGSYYWEPSSTATDDGFITIKAAATETGRWIRTGNSNTLKGTTTLSGAALTTTYNVSFGVTLPFVPRTVIYTPRTQAAAQVSWIPITGGITNTGFTISYLTVPILGTNNMLIDWVAIKQ